MWIKIRHKRESAEDAVAPMGAARSVGGNKTESSLTGKMSEERVVEYNSIINS